MLPPRKGKPDRLGALVEPADADGSLAGRQGGKASHAQAAFEEEARRLVQHRQDRVGDDVKRHRGSLALGETLRRDWQLVLFAIFDHEQPDRLSNLRRR